MESGTLGLSTDSLDGALLWVCKCTRRWYMLMRAVLRNTILNVPMCDILVCRESTASCLSGRPAGGRFRGRRHHRVPWTSRGEVCDSHGGPSFTSIRESCSMREHSKQLFMGRISWCIMPRRMRRLFWVSTTSRFPFRRGFLLLRGASVFHCLKTCLDRGCRSWGRLRPCLLKQRVLFRK